MLKLPSRRRLFYVGLTRARNAIYMRYLGCISDRYGAQRRGRTPFVAELEERLIAAEAAD